MDKRLLERNVMLHQTYAEIFISQFERLWGRDCTERERNYIESSTLCLSFMMQESVESALIHAMSVSEANKQYSFLESQVNERRAELVRVLEIVVEENGLPLSILDDSNLLSAEKVLLSQL
ncbi:hypothetical protein [Zooshikella harenae]|uniref:Uncharacterized protein n=1 Tax=Zooshikella harenae TaxID=2827238 RepID=A0ABS5ZIC7_9GAMM|nr:hypothetical protein [Zooshikella harenae]MBU2713829.1 hypothetical protein [Zooshikella harenae]